MITIEELKAEILEQSKFHQLEETDDSTAFLIEEEVEYAIIGYCEQKRYEVEGFPFIKSKIMHEGIEIEITNPDFELEKNRFYIMHLALEKEDVAELYWWYHHCFWGYSRENKESFLEGIRRELGKGI